MVALTNSHEVANFVQPLDQFQPGKSAYECVVFGCSDIFYCGQPGHAPTGSQAQIVSQAETWYARETGSNDASNTAGLTIGQEYDVLDHFGLKYEKLGGDLVAETRAALARGLPVLICGAEASFFDVNLGRVPYAWTPAGNHCIVASGVASNGDLLVRDYANSEFFGYCRQYSAAKMQLISATAVLPRWQEESMVPKDWKDSGTELTAPNGHTVRTGFRSKVMEGWEASDQPEEEEHGAEGGGTEQRFARTILRWTSAGGVTVHAPDPSAQAAAMRDALTQIVSIGSKAVAA